jgi:hypothetical protein
MIVKFFDMLLTTPEGAGALLGSFAGLIALVLAALFNAYLERRARAEVLIENRKSLTAALAAEVLAYKDLALRRKNHMGGNSSDQQALLSATGMPVRRLFDANAAVIGSLDSRITDDVALFYFKLEGLEIYLRDIEKHINGVEDMDEEKYNCVRDGIIDQWGKMADAASNLIKELSLVK